MNRIKFAKGFTLIELVMVIVILGVLAAVALPKFADLSGEAEMAKVKSLAGAVSSASAINLAAVKTGNSAGIEISGNNVCTTDVAASLFAQGFVEDYEVAVADGDEGIAGGDNSACNGAEEAAYCTVASTKNSAYRARMTILCTAPAGGGAYCDTHIC